MRKVSIRTVENTIGLARSVANGTTKFPFVGYCADLMERMLEEITARYTSQTTPYYAASRLWVDAIIDPLETRKTISMGIEMANNAPIEKKYNVGIIQT